MITGAVVLCSVLWLGLGLISVVVALLLTNLGISFIAPNATALGLSPYGRDAGSASAYLGVVQYGVGALSGPIAGLAGRTTEFSMAFGMLTMAALCFVTHIALVGRPPAFAAPILEDPMSGFIEPVGRADL